MAVNILIADDHDIIREGIKSVLSGRPEYVAGYIRSADLVKYALEQKII